MIPLLQTGDIILTTEHNWSDILSMIRFRSRYTHATMYYGENRTIEMTNKNVRHLTFSKRYAPKKIIIIRLRGLTIKDRVKLRRTARRYYHLKFDRLRLVLPLLPQFRKDRYWCTSFIDLIYKKALGRNIRVEYLMQHTKDYTKLYKADILYDYKKDR